MDLEESSARFRTPVQKPDESVRGNLIVRCPLHPSLILVSSPTLVTYCFLLVRDAHGEQRKLTAARASASNRKSEDKAFDLFWGFLFLF